MLRRELLADFIQAFNQRLQRLEPGSRVQQQLLGVIAHEPKDPRTLMRGQIELDDTGDKNTLLPLNVQPRPPINNREGKRNIPETNG